MFKFCVNRDSPHGQLLLEKSLLSFIQSEARDIRGHISKHGPSSLRFIMVNASHNVIKYSKRMRKKYLSLVKRIGKNKEIVAIARIFLKNINNAYRR